MGLVVTLCHYLAINYGNFFYNLLPAFFGKLLDPGKTKVLISMLQVRHGSYSCCVADVVANSPLPPPLPLLLPLPMPLPPAPLLTSPFYSTPPQVVGSISWTTGVTYKDPQAYPEYLITFHVN